MLRRFDFSVVKNGKDNYSFYFASKDSEIMEKGIKNVVENKIEKEQTKEKAHLVRWAFLFYKQFEAFCYYYHADNYSGY